MRDWFICQSGLSFVEEIEHNKKWEFLFVKILKLVKKYVFMKANLNFWHNSKSKLLLKYFLFFKTNQILGIVHNIMHYTCSIHWVYYGVLYHL